MVNSWSVADQTASHPDLSAMCLATAKDSKCVLVSRRKILIFNTENLSKSKSIILRETKWDTSYAEFSEPEPKQLSLTNAHSIQIFNIDDYHGNFLIHTLNGHTRNITDLNWSPKLANILASSSYDNYIHVWDLRDTRKPAYLMHSISGATQVKWSKINENILATSHEGDVRIWDNRKSNTPLHYVSTHLAKINGIDWNPFYENKFMTCSQDGNIKLWDLNTCHKGKCEYHLTTCLAIWKARYTPFGNGLLTALVPQMRRTGGENNSLWMWNIESLEQPAHSFAGHSDVVLDFGWTMDHVSDHTDGQDDAGTITNHQYHQLITWARDNTFRLWRVNVQELCQNVFQSSLGNDHHDDHQIQQSLPHHLQQTEFLSADDLSSDYDSQSGKLSCNIDLSKSSNLSSPCSERFETSKTTTEFEQNSSNFPEDKSSDLATSTSFSSKTIFSLKQEFSLFNENIPNIIIEDLNIAKRTCIASIKSSLIYCRLKIFFPINYPNMIPQFSFLNEPDGPSGSAPSTTGKSLDESIKKEVLKVLQSTATLQVQRNRNCLEKCLRQFVQTVEKMTSVNLTASNPPATKPQPTVLDLLTSYKYGSYRDAAVPFPRTSGARFCSSEILVCFGRPPHLEQMSVPNEYTPRSLSALSNYFTSHVVAFSANQKDNIPSISSFYIDSSKKRRYRTVTNNNNQQLVDHHQNKTPRTPNLCGPVIVFSVTKLLPISRQLAEQYLMPSPERYGDILLLCEMNAKIASQSQRRDLFQTWYLVRLSAELFLKNRLLLLAHYPLTAKQSLLYPQWERHPLGGKMIKSMIEHYVLICNDIQTAAMISSVISACKIHSDNQLIQFQLKRSNNNNNDQQQQSPPLGVPDDTWTIISNRENQTRSSSCSEMLLQHQQGSEDHHHHRHHNDSQLIETISEHSFEPELMLQYDYYKKIYADILYRWKLIKKRAQLLRTIETAALNDDHQSVVPFATECHVPGCGELCSTYLCHRCNKISQVCIICRLPVKGAANHCLKCGHGGHTAHLLEWFQSHNKCPTGCGCDCI